MAIPDRPVIFMKPRSCVVGHLHDIPHPTVTQELDYEVELAIVIGKRCKNVTSEEALQYVLGFTVANDVSARDWQIRLGGGQWTRGKIFEGFCPLGPVLTTTDEIGDVNALRMRTRLNDQVVQDSSTSDLIFNVEQVISYLSQGTVLAPGTVILTGTPEGVGLGRNPQLWMKPGDIVEVEIERIGKLRNTVVAEVPPSSHANAMIERPADTTTVAPPAA